MKSRLLASLILLAAALPASAQDEKKAEEPKSEKRPRITLADFEDAVLDVADRVRPAVVAIDARHEGDEAHVVAPRRVALSGVIWDDEGLVIALGRDLESASALTVAPLDGEPLKAKLEGVDDETGVAVLRVGDESKKLLKPLERGTTDKLRPGAFVVAVGNPLGLRHSVAFGTVAGVGRTVKRGSFVTKEAIQITVPVNPGDPGGCVADSRGRMIGVLASALRRAEGVGFERDLIDMMKRGIERLFPEKSDGKKPAPPPARVERRGFASDEPLLGGAQGISFAITVEEVARAVERVKKEGGRPKPVLGVECLPLDAFESPASAGVVVIGVRDGSPAAKADIRAKDVILTYNGKDVRDLDDLRRMVRESALGTQVKVEVLREGKRISLDVTFDGRKP